MWTLIRMISIGRNEGWEVRVDEVILDIDSLQERVGESPSLKVSCNLLPCRILQQHCELIDYPRSEGQHDISEQTQSVVKVITIRTQATCLAFQNLRWKPCRPRKQSNCQASPHSSTFSQESFNIIHENIPWRSSSDISFPLCEPSINLFGHNKKATSAAGNERPPRSQNLSSNVRSHKSMCVVSWKRLKNEIKSPSSHD